jgi:hypothetical protein
MFDWIRNARHQPSPMIAIAEMDGKSNNASHQQILSRFSKSQGHESSRLGDGNLGNNIIDVIKKAQDQS